MLKKLKTLIDDNRYPIMLGLAGSAVAATAYTIYLTRYYNVLVDVKDGYRDGLNLLANTLLRDTDVTEEDITKLLQTVSPDFYYIGK